MCETKYKDQGSTLKLMIEMITSLPDLVDFLPLLLTLLPDRYQWTTHNMFAHPIGEILFQVGLEDWGNRIHDITIPASCTEDKV